MNLRPGDAPPPFALADLSGRRVGSDALAGGAAVVLFWSTWSPRSAEMLDDFKRHAATYAAKGLKVVAINIDGENLGAAQQAAIREYAAARELPFPVLLDEGSEDLLGLGRHGAPDRGRPRRRRAHRLRPAGLPGNAARGARGGDQEGAGHGGSARAAATQAPPARRRRPARWRTSGGSSSPRGTRSGRARRSGGPRPRTPPPSRPRSWSRASRSRSAAPPRPSSWPGRSARRRSTAATCAISSAA